MEAMMKAGARLVERQRLLEEPVAESAPRPPADLDRTQ